MLSCHATALLGFILVTRYCVAECSEMFIDSSNSFYQRQQPPCCNSECCCTTCPPSECTQSPVGTVSNGNVYAHSSSPTCICENTAAFTCYRASYAQGVQSLVPMSANGLYAAYVPANQPAAPALGSYSLSGILSQQSASHSNYNNGLYMKAPVREGEVQFSKDCACDSPPSVCTPSQSCQTLYAGGGSVSYGNAGYDEESIFGNPWGIMIFVTIIVLAVLILILIVYLLCYSIRSRGARRYSDEPAIVATRRVHEWR